MFLLGTKHMTCECFGVWKVNGCTCRNLEMLVRLPGGDSARGFFMVTLLVELAAAPGLRVKTHPNISHF